MKFNEFQIKLFMMILMVLDHLSMIPGLLPFEVIAIFHLITRPVAVWFAYTLVEGFFHTHNRFAYCKRLFAFAFFILVGDILFSYLYASKGILILNNIILALAFSCLILILFFDDSEKTLKIPRPIRILVGIASFILCTLFAEGSFIIPTLVLIFYYYRDNPLKRNIWLFALSAFMFLPSYMMYTDGLINIYGLLAGEWFYFSIIPFISVYNGERGPNTPFTKYLFYIFYPAHVWILATIAFLVS